MRWKAFAPFGHSKAPVATIIIMALLATPVLVLVSTMRSGVVIAAPGDNFGYDTIGGSSVFYEYSMIGSVFTCPSDEIAGSIVVYTLDEAGGEAFQCAIYDMDGQILQNGTTEIRTDLGEEAGWYSFNFSTQPDLNADNEYVLECRTEEVTFFWYDNGDGETQGYYQNGELSSFPSQAEFVSQDRKYSIYCVFGSPPPTPVYPTKPLLFSPENNENIGIDSTPRFVWTMGENADNHRLRVDNDIDYSSPEEDTVIVSDNFYTITTELPNDNYYWQVIAVNENGENASGNWTFQVDILAGWITPVLVENFCGEEAGYEATKSIDENINSLWWHNTTENHWIIFDMGVPRKITKLRLYHDASPFGGYEGILVYVSENTVDWGDNVWEGELGAIGWNEAGSFDENARYIKLQSKDNYVQQVIYEFQAYAGKFIVSPNLNLPENDWTINDNTPYFEWEFGTGGIFVENYRLLVDDDSDFSSPIENQFFDNMDNDYIALSEYPWDNYYWKVIASRENESMENSSVVWEFELIYSIARIATLAATDVGGANATLNASIEFGSHENVDIRFKYKSDEQCYTEGENENWSLSDHYYNPPQSPDNTGDWANRNPVNYIAASDSSGYDFANWVCDGPSGIEDQWYFQQAIDNLMTYGGGTLYFYAGTYWFADNKIRFENNISWIGEGRENTIINGGKFTQWWSGLTKGRSENLLFENFTFNGGGRLIDVERNGIYIINMENVVFRNLRVENVSAEGFYVERTSTHGGENVREIWIIDCLIQNTGEHGIALAGGNAEPYNLRDIYILNNTLVGCGLGSQFKSGGKGIYVFDADDVIIANNTIESCGNGAIHLGGYYDEAAKNILVQGNYLRRNNLLIPEDGLAIEIGGAGLGINDNFIIRGNDIDQFKGIGITVEDNNENHTVDNNSLYNTVFGITENYGVGHIIENNVQSHFDADNNYTTWETFPKVINYNSQDNLQVAENLYSISVHAFKSHIRYDTTEAENTIEDWRTFTTQGIGQPILYFPDNDNALTSSPVFEWTNGEGASYHRLIVDNDYDFSSPTIDLNIPVPDNTYASMLSADNYWWYVIAVYGISENNSDNWTFELNVPIPYEGSGTVADPYIIPNVELLQMVNDYNSSHFALGNDIDASITTSWNDGAGFVPIGDNDYKFTGSLDGRSYIINSLFINRGNENFVGIFGGIGNDSILENIGVENVSIIGSNYTGGLAGYNEGIVSRCYSAGSVSGDNYVGGLVGYNTENVINTYSTGSVTGYSDVGGLVGHNDGLVSNSYSVGPVSGYYNVGGIVGYEISYEGAAWTEVETWTNYLDAGPVWRVVETWTNYLNANPIVSVWYEVETWTNYAATPQWYVVETWTNYMDAGTLTLYENYSVPLPDLDTWIYGINWRAQTFTVELGNHTVSSIKIEAYRKGNPGILLLSIKATDGSGHPTGADLTTGTIDADTFTTSLIGDWYEIDVDRYSLDNGTKYAMVFRALSGSESNEVRWLGDYTSPTYAGGNLETSSDNGSSWNTYTEYDMMFEVWGYPSDGTVSNSFYDNQTSGQSDNGKGIGLSTVQMQLISTFSDAGWDIVLREDYTDEIWYIDNGNDYPKLGWEAIALGWYEVATWTNYLESYPIGWYEVETWTNYIHVLNWHEVETWTNYLSANTWYEVATWTNYVDATPVGWWEVGTWTNYLDASPPGWYEVGTWTNYLNAGLTKPVLIFPENSSSTYDNTPTFQWISGRNADNHRFLLDTEDTFSTPVENVLLGASATTYMITSPLKSDNYWWKVIAIKGGNENSTDVWTFELKPSPPPPPPEEITWAVFIIRFLAVIAPFGVIAWKFTKIKDPVTGAEAAAWAGLGFVAFVILWFVADAVEAVLYAI